jgi:hypothetical protein
VTNIASLRSVSTTLRVDSLSISLLLTTSLIFLLFTDAVSSSDDGANSNQPMMYEVSLPASSPSLLSSRARHRCSGPMPSLSQRNKLNQLSVKRLAAITLQLSVPMSCSRKSTQSNTTTSSHQTPAVSCDVPCGPLAVGRVGVLELLSIITSRRSLIMILTSPGTSKLTQQPSTGTAQKERELCK